MQKNPYIEINSFDPKCYDVKVDHIRIGLTKEQYISCKDMGNIDIFKYLDSKDLADIKANKKYLIFDYSQEGIHQRHYNLFKCLDFNCKLYSIHKKQIIYLTSNFLEIEEYGFKPFVYQPWIDFMQINYIEKECNEAFEFTIDQCIKNYDENIFYSSFNKTWDRPWRDYFHFLLYKNNLLDKGFVSNHNRQDRLFGGMQLKDEKINGFRKLLPLKFDYPYFWSAGKGYQADIYAFTTPQFHIVGESIVNIKKHCFFSEKSFKPVAFFQPFFVIGPANFQKDLLSKLKIKTYNNLNQFNLDDKLDMYEQARKTSKKLPSFLSNLSKTNRIDWRFREESTLKHNWMILRSYSANQKMFRKLNKMLAK